MSRVNADFDVQLYTAAGVALPQANTFLTLANATTYYAELRIADVRIGAMQWSWDAALVAAITYESTNLPTDQASTFVAAGNLWALEPVSTVSPASAALTVMQHFADFGARRLRAKIVVTTGGTAQLRGRFHGKNNG